MKSRTKLDRSFFSRPTTEVARSLLGQILVHGDVESAITEVEAYLPYDDPAAHAFRGITPRTRILFGPAGFAYMFLNYGIHWMLNISTEEEGVPGCILVRSTELFRGPGRLTKGYGLNGTHYGLDVTKSGLYVLPNRAASEVLVTPRIGITKAADRLLRYVVAPTPANEPSRSQLR